MSVERDIGEIKATLESIENLIKTQNGRVGKLEDQVGALRRWQMLVIGAFTTAGTGIGTVIGKFTGG